MAGCVSSSIKTVETLLEMGANPWKMSCNDLTPLDWAKRFSKSEAVELLECYKYLLILMDCFFFFKFYSKFFY